ncbi:MarR family winged helix-turn-helix transcriptional regulator [Planctomonas sp. JC2975]|uniref:MarR family winged helix-turn-helix transcriptional regulator n=1 Tax=Planctomonas sp. JC2975 TaxID=2729626 RepID=UPI0014761919|nr:MarR family winged helix-turn-helix transcriptional regulator [Planctomonas sp. JC2975]
MKSADSARIDYGELLADLVFVQVDQFNVVDRRLRSDLDMVLIEYLPMRVIDGTPNCRVQDLANGVRITVGGASKAVDRLSKRGWAERAPHPGDRRSSILRLTPEGERMLAAASGVVSEETSRRLAITLDAAETATLADLLSRLRADEDGSTIEGD